MSGKRLSLAVVVCTTDGPREYRSGRPTYCTKPQPAAEPQALCRGFTPAIAAAAEFIARSEPNIKLDRWLASRGVDVDNAWNVVGPICAHTIALWPHGLFNFLRPEDDLSEIEPEGRSDHIRAAVHIVRDIDDETPVDLVAWQPHHPGRMFRYLGEAVMLGASQLGNPASYLAGEALPVHLTALDWLAAGCRGVVILDPKKFVVRLSALPQRVDGYALAAADLAHAKKLRAFVGTVERLRLLVPIGDAT